MEVTITSFDELQQFLSQQPDGTGSTSNGLDMETGNIDRFTLDQPDGTSINVVYTGEVVQKDGYPE